MSIFKGNTESLKTALVDRLIASNCQVGALFHHSVVPLSRVIVHFYYNSKHKQSYAQVEGFAVLHKY